MDLNPAYSAYTNLGITDTDMKDKPSKGMGLLSPMGMSKPKEELNEPRDRVRQYVARIRKARKQVTDGRNS